MTDNRTTELREKLNKLIIEIERLDIKLDSPAYGMTLGEYEQEREKLLDEFEQAIAATLGSGNCARCAEDMGRYADSLCDPLKERIAELLRCLENDWNIRASWDGLRKFWCIELTEEGVKLRDAAHGTLTSEQVRKAIMSADRWEKPMGNTGLTNTHLIIRDDGWQAIADELNAELGSGTCGNVDKYPSFRFTCSECGCRVYYEDYDGEPYMFVGECAEVPRFCPNCGAKVVTP